MLPSLTTAAWISFALVAIISTLLLRLTVRVLAKTADNGWDNALAYGAVNLVLAVALNWIFHSGSYFLIAIAPLLIWAAQTIALVVIYEMRALRAWAVGIVHALITTTVVTGLALTAAMVAAYILYGKIISDPMFLIRLILRLIGIEI
jgi:hypothetical protein